MRICLGCREEFNKQDVKKMKNGYCETCFKSLNLQDNLTISVINITDKKEEEEKKHYIKVILLLLSSLGILALGAYTAVVW